MKPMPIIVLVFVSCLGCREQLPETPGLTQATQERNAGPRSPPPTGMSEESLREHLTGGTRVFADNFDREELGARWIARSPGWKIADGRVTNTSAKNKGLWLQQQLPSGNVRIEFDATSTPFSGKDRAGKAVTKFPGDIKCEAFNKTPNHQGGYIFIFGGWDNKVNRIARVEEHGDGPGARVQDGPQFAVKPNHAYRMRVVRVDKTIAWFADDQLLVQMTDSEFIDGKFFGFNNWEAHVAFDNIAVFKTEVIPSVAAEKSGRRTMAPHKPNKQQTPSPTTAPTQR